MKLVKKLDVAKVVDYECLLCHKIIEGRKDIGDHLMFDHTKAERSGKVQSRPFGEERRWIKRENYHGMFGSK